MYSVFFILVQGKTLLSEASVPKASTLTARPSPGVTNTDLGELKSI